MAKLNAYKEPEFEKLSSQKVEVKLPLMLPVPGGEFLMGTSDEDIKHLQLKEADWAYDWSDNDMFANERPQHKVTVAPFEIAQYPITNAEYYQFTYVTGHRLPKTWKGFTFQEDLGNHPVTGVSRRDIEAYLDWLKEMTGIQFRLPTEAEWENAARGNDGRIYPWGKIFDPWVCNTSESAKKGTTPVGSYSPAGDSPYGAADMVGNIWEWTSSVFGPYPFREYTDGELPAAQVRYVVRGGAWYYSRKLARCAAREGAREDYSSHLIGFRLARSK